VHHIELALCHHENPESLHGLSENCYQPNAKLPTCNNYIIAWAIGAKVNLNIYHFIAKALGK